MKKILAMLLALVMVFALVACGNSGDDTKPSENPTASGTPDTSETPDDSGASKGTIKIGHLCDLTGVESMTGGEAKDAMEYAVKYMGDIAGLEIELIHQDTKSDSGAAVDAARTLVEEFEVDVIFGPSLIGHKAGVANFAKEAEIPVLYYNPTPEMMIKDNPWVIGTAGSNPQMPTVMADYVYNELGYDAVVTLTKDDTGGKSYMNPFTANFEKLGGKVLDQAWAPVSDDTDYANYLMTIADKAGEADCLVAWTSAGSAIQLWNAWYTMNLCDTLPIVAVFHGAFTDSFVCDALSKNNPALVEEILGSIAPMTWAYDMQIEECAAFVKQYQADHNGAYPIANNLPAATVSAMITLEAAVEALKGDISDKEALRDAILATDTMGPEGRTYFEEGTNIAAKDIYVCKVVKLDNGQYHYSMVKAYEAVPVSGLIVE